MHTPPASLPVADAIVSADDMQLQVGTRSIPWADFWALLDEQAGLLHTPLQPAASRTEGGAQ